MLSQNSVCHHQGRRRYVRFCGAVELDLPDVLVLCGDGYHNRCRQVRMPYCSKHLCRFVHSREFREGNKK